MELLKWQSMRSRKERALLESMAKRLAKGFRAIEPTVDASEWLVWDVCRKVVVTVLAVESEGCVDWEEWLRESSAMGCPPQNYSTIWTVANFSDPQVAWTVATILARAGFEVRWHRAEPTEVTAMVPETVIAVLAAGAPTLPGWEAAADIDTTCDGVEEQQCTVH